jgi:hypothetical protein
VRVLCGCLAWLVRAGDKGVARGRVPGRSKQSAAWSRNRPCHTLVHTPRNKGEGVVCVVRMQGEPEMLFVVVQTSQKEELEPPREASNVFVLHRQRLMLRFRPAPTLS